MHDQRSTIESFLGAVAGPGTPAGACVAALSAAMGAALGHMVMDLSAAKGSGARAAEACAARDELARASQLFTSLMAEDQAAFEAFTASRKLPPDDPARLAALVACIRVPQAVAAAGVAVLEICDRVAGLADGHLLADLAVCADLAMAAVRTGSNIARVNARELPNPAERDAVDEEMRRELARSIDLVRQLSRRLLDGEPTR